jgi:hypothetical protein
MKTGVEYEFTTSTTDLNGHLIWYLFDWGDETNSSWIDPYDSGNPATASHDWDADGVYKIKTKARDFYNAESEWSDESVDIVPKTTPDINNPLLHPRLFFVLQQLLEL